MSTDWLTLFERIAENGTAPDEGCTELGVGYEDAIDRIQRKYLVERFTRGKSAEKFIIGPFGSGKTLFLRRVMEAARSTSCVTAEIKLNKDVEFAQSLIVYSEVAREIRAPGRPRGVRSFLEACLEQVAAKTPSGSAAEEFRYAWIAALETTDFELESFARVARRACEALMHEEEAILTLACRWLGGDMADREVASKLGVHVISQSERNLYGRRSLLSLMQLAKRAGFVGTVLCFDEAEQSLDVDNRKMERILAMLQAGINAVADLDAGSALLLYAITPTTHERMMEFAALQQRISDAGPDLGFFDGNVLAPTIDLTKSRQDPIGELRAIGERLTRLFFANVPDAPSARQDEALARVAAVASEIGTRDASTSARREMAKWTSSHLLMLRDATVAVRLRDREMDAEV